MKDWLVKHGTLISFCIIMVLLVLFALFVEKSNAAGVTITTGSKTGNYFKVGHNVRSVMGGGEVLPSKGSVENMDRIMADEADIGLVQMDAYAWYTANNPEAEDKVEIMGPLYKECVYIAVNKNGPIKTEDDLQQEGVTIAVGKEGSGSAVTWDYMRQLEKGYKKAAVAFKGGTRTLGKIAAKPDGKIHAMLWVTKPSLSGKLAQTVLKNKDLVFLDVDDNQLNNKYKPTGQPIYEFQNIKAASGFFGGSVETICVDAAVVANADSDEDMLEKLSDKVLNYKSSIVKK